MFRATGIYSRAYSVIPIMQEITTYSLSDSEEKLVSALRTLGMPRIEARLAVYLSIGRIGVNPRQIEIEANLRQPEVSLAMSKLRNKGYLEGYHLKCRLSNIAKQLYDARVAPLTNALDVLEGEKQ